jgi:hypothetical protein
MGDGGVEVFFSPANPINPTDPTNPINSINPTNPMPPKHLVALIYAAGLLLGSAIPGDDPLGGYNFTLYLNPTVQNLLHVPAFAGLAFLVMRSRFGEGWGTWKRNAVAFLACAGFGVVCELIQIWVPGRFAGVDDALFNVLGVLAGLWMVTGVARYKLRAQRNWIE